MDSVCDYCKAKKVWQGSMAAGRMGCPNGCEDVIKDDGPNYDEEYVQDLSAKPVVGTQHRIDTLNIPSGAKNLLVSLFNVMNPWQTSGLPIGLWRITKDPRVCCQALCIHCLRTYDWLGSPNQFRIEQSQCPSCYSASMNIKQAAKPIQPTNPMPPQGGAPGSLALKRGLRYDQNKMAFVALCRGCGTEYIVHDQALYDPSMSYCGRTPRCQP